jgi:hypothetical protein
MIATDTSQNIRNLLSSEKRLFVFHFLNLTFIQKQKQWKIQS